MQVTTFFGAIADDFTGATDLAALLARSGVPVSLRLGIPDDGPTDTAAIEIIALKCRTAPVDVAVRETRQALSWLRQAGAQRFYWKYCSTFDSTPEGNIGPVSEVLMNDLGSQVTVYCPAFPENGRTVFMGNLFVGEQLLSESSMKDHPLTPMTDANLLRLLAPQVSRPVGLVSLPEIVRGGKYIRDRMDALAEVGVGNIVVDAIAEEDLRSIAAAVEGFSLVTGGSALAQWLPSLWLAQGYLAPEALHSIKKAPPGRAVILSGSCSRMTNCQVQDYLQRGEPAYRLDPFYLADRGPEPVLQWLSEQPADTTPLIYATAEPDAVQAAQARLGAEQTGGLVEAALAQCATHALQLGIRRFVVAGGETSGAVAQGLGIRRVDVGPEIAPGVPWCFARSQSLDLALAMKSGNFGTATFFSDALELLA